MAEEGEGIPVRTKKTITIAGAAQIQVRIQEGAQGGTINNGKANI
jgi:hypothetical protein